MDVETNFHDARLACFSAVIFITGLMACSVYIKNWWTKKTAPFWDGDLAPELSIRWLWLFFAFVWLVLHYIWISYLLPFVAIVIAILAISSKGNLPLSFWNLQSGKIGDYFIKATKVFFAMLIPLYFATILYRLFLMQLDFPITTQPAIDQLLEAKQKGREYWFYIEAFMVAPLWEEVLFRGFLYPVLKSKWGKWSAILATSVLFAGMHAHIPTLFPLFLFGIVLALIYERYGSLGYAIMLHAIFNVVSSIFIVFVRG